MVTEVCALDHQTEQWHKDHNVKHQFSPAGDLKRVEPPKTTDQAGVARPGGADPVLRALLLEKGIITVAELGRLEDTLRSTGVIVVHEAASHT